MKMRWVSLSERASSDLSACCEWKLEVKRDREFSSFNWAWTKRCCSHQERFVAPKTSWVLDHSVRNFSLSMCKKKVEQQWCSSNMAKGKKSSLIFDQLVHSLHLDTRRGEIERRKKSDRVQLSPNYELMMIKIHEIKFYWKIHIWW